MFSYETQTPDEFIPICTVNLEGHDLTDMKSLNESLHNQAFLLGLTLQDFEEEYKIEIEEVQGYSYLVLSISVKYYEYIIEREQTIGTSLYQANPGLLNLH